MKTINSNLYPKEGFHFKDSDGTVIRADSWAGVIARVVKYRARAGLAPGDPPAEVIEQACRDNPGLCRTQSNVANLQLRKTSLKASVLKWISGLWESREAWPMQFVENAEREKRSQICAKCPNNTALPGGCASCRAALDSLRKRLIGNRFIDGRLNACLILGEDLPLTVHLEHVALDNKELPNGCWRKRQL